MWHRQSRPLHQGHGSGKWNHALDLLNIVDPKSSGAKPYDGANIESQTKKQFSTRAALPKFDGTGDADYYAEDFGGLRPEDVNVETLTVAVPKIYKGVLAIADIGERQKDYCRSMRSSPDEVVTVAKVHEAFAMPLIASKKRAKGN